MSTTYLQGGGGGVRCAGKGGGRGGGEHGEYRQAVARAELLEQKRLRRVQNFGGGQQEVAVQDVADHLPEQIGHGSARELDGLKEGGGGALVHAKLLGDVHLERDLREQGL